MNSEKIGNFIKELRGEKNITQQELAEKLSTTRETISKWERGVYTPNIEFLIKLKDIFDVSVSELYYGERKTSNNEGNVDNVTIEIIKSKEKKIRKVVNISFIIILILIILFLIFYFLSNYNSIKVYKIFGRNNDIFLDEGIMIVSPEKCYIQLGNVKSEIHENITKIRLFYQKDGKENLIFMDHHNHTNYLIINDFRYNELFKYKDIKYIKNNLFLELGFENKNKIVINLKLEEDFSNKLLFSNNKIQNITEENIINEKKNSIPEYIKKNYKYDKKNDKYYLNKKEKTKIINKEYINDINIYIIDEKQGNTINHYDYFINDGTLTYYKAYKEIVDENFTYNITTKECVYGNCDNKLIEHFKEKYLNDIK